MGLPSKTVQPAQRLHLALVQAQIVLCCQFL